MDSSLKPLARAEEAGPPGLEVVWPAPAAVKAWMSTRWGGVSPAPYGALNLGAHVGDASARVAENRARAIRRFGVSPIWLNQVHGAEVVHLGPHSDSCALAPADASVTAQPGVACAVLVADCLPVLFAADNARAAGAAHAGWRGLAAGVLEQTAQAVASAAGCAPGELHAWLGPCIGPRHFEVGPEVREAFGARGLPFFAPHRRRDGSAAWLADLAGLAGERLRSAGLVSISGGHWCTVEDPERFYSYRRDGVTGRMAAFVALA